LELFPPMQFERRQSAFRSDLDCRVKSLCLIFVSQSEVDHRLGRCSNAQSKENRQEGDPPGPILQPSLKLRSRKATFEDLSGFDDCIGALN
jgi:hypothetical protein